MPVLQNVSLKNIAMRGGNLAAQFAFMFVAQAFTTHSGRSI
jgi:hypothetical protein